MIKTIEELVALQGQTVYLVTCFHSSNDAITRLIGNTHLAEWHVGVIINQTGEPYSAESNGPWFCFEKTKTRFKGNRLCNFMFNTADYIGSPTHGIFETEAKADAFRMKLKLQTNSTKIDFVDLSQYFVFEGASISLEDFKAGQIPTFGKDSWVQQ